MSFPFRDTVSNRILLSYSMWRPCSSQGDKFLHWLTSNTSSSLHPSMTDSTPFPVTRTHPRTDSSRNSIKCKPIQRNEGSETAEPQKDRFNDLNWGQPRARTSVAVSERAQQNDYKLDLSVENSFVG